MAFDFDIDLFRQREMVIMMTHGRDFFAAYP